jgi:hypothetical protein
VTAAPARCPYSRGRPLPHKVPVIDADEPSNFVFSVNGRTPFDGWSKAKARLDRKLALNEPWQLRDLRRTSRTLMSRKKVPMEIAERCLGHVMTLVRGTYDRYDYLAEKQEAFEKLSAAVEDIIPARKCLGSTMTGRC